MQSIVLESELSPVRENAQEEDEAEQASLEEERKKREEEERNVQKRESMDSLKAISSEGMFICKCVILYRAITNEQIYK